MILCERIKDFHALGAVGVIAINPGKVAHWGGGSPIWGTADLDDLPFKPAIPAGAVSKPDGEALIALRAKRRQREALHRLRRRLVQEPRAGGGDQGPQRPSSCCCTATTTPGTSASATTPPATPACSRSRACCGQQRDKLERSVRIAWWPGPFDRPFRRLDLVRRHVRARSGEELRRAHELRQPRLPRRHRLPVHPLDGRECRLREGRGA